jgi:hypothetical protein
MTTDTPDPVPARSIPAPALRETADIWFDTGRDPVIVWDAEGRRFRLQDPRDATCSLHLVTYPIGVSAPAELAAALAEGLAACDFPPTGDGAAAGHVASALRAYGIAPPPD